MIAKCRKEPGTARVSQQMQRVFDQYDDMDDDGIMRGGGGKLSCLQGGYLPVEAVEELAETPCKDIIEELRSLFHDLYRHIPLIADTRPEMQEKIGRKRDKDEKVQNAIKKLVSSEEVLAIIDKHLASNWDVDNDCSFGTVDVFPDLVPSTSGQKRKAEDDGRKFNEKVKGRFPSSSSQRRRILGPQRVRSLLGSRSGTRTSESR